MISATVDLRSQLLPVREQGRRQACLPFASSCAHEHQRTADVHLSVEYLFFHAIARASGNPLIGTTMSATAVALAEDGQPLEAEWPYALVQPDPWSPPTLKGEAWKTTLVPNQLTFDDLISHLDKGAPIVLGLVITDAFFDPDDDGVVPDLTPDIERAGHAVLAVGHGMHGGEPAILVRNSWGEAWGLQGYAWLTRTYIDRQLRETATLI